MTFQMFITFAIPLFYLFYTLDTMVKHLQSADAFRSFSEFRQEASMLHYLQHPCIVSLVGISIHPLCFALQLAPLGSLNTVLEERHKGKGTSSDLPHEVVLKVCFTRSCVLSSRLQLYAPWSHAYLQSSLSDCSWAGIPSQKEHHLL